MIVKLWDKTEFYVTDEQSDKIKQAISRDEPSIEIGDRWMRSSAISTIMPGGDPITYDWGKPTKLIDKPDYRGVENRGESFEKAKATRDAIKQKADSFPQVKTTI